MGVFVLERQSKSAGQRFLDIIEKLGNKLPDPIVLFIIIAAIILVASWITGMLGISVVNPADGETVEARNLMSADGLVLMVTESINNFTEFPALGMVLVVMIGIGIAEKTGYFEALLKRTLEVAPVALIIPTIIIVGILANVAGDAGPVILPPVAAIIFMKLGYNPLIGLIMAYATTNGAFSANIIPGMTDALAAGFTEPAAQLINEDYSANILMNYYFMAASSVFLIFVIYFVTKKITIPRLGTYDGPEVDDEKLEPEELSSLKWANISFLVGLLIVAVLSIPPDGILRNPETGSLVNEAPLIDGAVLIITVLFFIPGLVYGIKIKAIQSTKDFGNILTDSMKTMANYIVLVFFIAQMLAFFNWSNLGPIIAVSGSNMLQAMNMEGIPLFITFIVIIMFINLLIGSASAKWGILAPIFVPMFMLLGYDPALTQILYRVGDSVTNPISPLMPYLPLLLTFAKKYDNDIRLGTLIANLLPYSVFIFITWVLFVIVWYLLGIPVGPNGPIYLPE